MAVCEASAVFFITDNSNNIKELFLCLLIDHLKQ